MTDMTMTEAAFDDDVRHLARLIAGGGDVDAVSKWGDPLIVSAAKFDLRNNVDLLIWHGANLDAQASDGSTALHWAVWNGHPEIVKRLIEGGANIHGGDRRETPYECAMHRRGISRTDADNARLVAPFGDGAIV